MNDYVLEVISFIILLIIDIFISIIIYEVAEVRLYKVINNFIGNNKLTIKDTCLRVGENIEKK